MVNGEKIHGKYYESNDNPELDDQDIHIKYLPTMKYLKRMHKAKKEIQNKLNGKKTYQYSYSWCIF